MMKANIIMLFLVVPVLIFVGVVYGNQPWTPWRIFGVVIGVPSLALLVLAHIQLGSSFAIVPKAQALVTHGLYSKIRNPIYIFGALTIAGGLLYFNQEIFFLLFLVVVPLQIYRVRLEEKALEEKFGEEYRQYKARTWF